MLGGVLARIVFRIVVLAEATPQIVGLPDVETPRRLALHDVDDERQTPRVGFEPTT